MADGDEPADLNTLKERKVNKGFAIDRVLVHAAEYFTAYAEQARMFYVLGALVERTGVLPLGPSLQARWKKAQTRRSERQGN